MGIKVCFPCRMSQAQGFSRYLSKTGKLQHTTGTEQILILSCGSQHRTPTPSLLGKHSQQQGELQKSDHLYLLLPSIFISVVAAASLRVELNSAIPCQMFSKDYSLRRFGLYSSTLFQQHREGKSFDTQFFRAGLLRRHWYLLVRQL